MFKIEYRSQGGHWYSEHVCGLVRVAAVVRKLRQQGFEVRCLNEVGQNIA